MSQQRSFKIVAVSTDDGVDFEGGIYHGKQPGQAAKKAFNQYCRKADLGKCVRRFSIQELTKGSDKKQFHYVGTRAKLNPPKEMERGDKIYFIKYESNVKKAQ